jgi:hypothetical protein
MSKITPVTATLTGSRKRECDAIATMITENPRRGERCQIRGDVHQPVQHHAERAEQLAAGQSQPLDPDPVATGVVLVHWESRQRLPPDSRSHAGHPQPRRRPHLHPSPSSSWRIRLPVPARPPPICAPPYSTPTEAT